MDFGISERRLGVHRGFHDRFSGILAMVSARPASSRQRQWHKVKTLLAPPPNAVCILKSLLFSGAGCSRKVSLRMLVPL